MSEYVPDHIVIRAATQRAERLSDEDYARQLEAEITERNDAADGYGPAVKNYRPDLLMGTLRVAPRRVHGKVYGLLLSLSQARQALPSDPLVCGMARRCLRQIEADMIRDLESKTLLRASAADAGTLLQPARGPGPANPDELLRAPEAEEE